MNSLNFLSARVTSQPTPIKAQKDRPRSYSDGTLNKADSKDKLRRSSSHHIKRATKRDPENEKSGAAGLEDSDSPIEIQQDTPNEKTSLLEGRVPPVHSKLRNAAKRFATALAASLRWVLSSLASPVVYLVSNFRDDKGNFSLMVPIRKILSLARKRNGRRSTAQAIGLSGSSENYDAGTRRDSDASKYDNGVPSSASDSDTDSRGASHVPAKGQPKSFGTSSSSDESTQARRSVRIKLSNEEGGRKRKQKRPKADPPADASEISSAALAKLKSPTSPASSARSTKVATTPAPPRPLIPRRQPSYSSQQPRSSRFAQKTLVIDLDETLIHSMSKGGRMSSGHMVEVRLNNTVGYGGASLGPQHPILYYVHKRPHCDEFLRKVCKWYNLIVFTASVQEYADSVIDWLEQERQYFSGRYYRQHCTLRNGAYIKDLSSVEPDLSKVMILDNSPLSYIFHEDNAIPIEGWINDPTDNDLLHLIPILEALQYTTDVRALLSLRRGVMVA